MSTDPTNPALPDPPRTVPLPMDPDLRQLRRRARELQRAVRRDEPDAVAVVAAFHPRPPTPADRPTFALADAQLTLARQHGFASWPRLRRHLDVVEQFTWTPAAPGERPDATVDPVDAVLADACLDYADDDPARWTAASERLATEPDLAARSIHLAAAAADVDRVRAHLAADPSRARARGGPQRWCPLFFLAYSRLDRAFARDDVLATAAALLDAGADPDEGYLWHGLPTPFTLLTGCFGHGELGPARQPSHPCGVALAHLLLDAGADPNDGQALYNRQFRANDEHLEVLFAHGLGAGDGGVWHERLGEALDPPSRMLRHQLWWAVTHGFADRVALLADHGVDVDAPFTDEPFAHAPAQRGRPIEVAARAGWRAVVDVLAARGVASPALDPAAAFTAAALEGDLDELDRLAAAGAADAAREQRPALLVAVAGRRSTAVVRRLVALGFDVDRAGRVDLGNDHPWETPLHVAVMEDDEPMVRALLELGADPEVRDARFDQTPLGWAHHFGHAALADLLQEEAGGTS